MRPSSLKSYQIAKNWRLGNTSTITTPDMPSKIKREQDWKFVCFVRRDVRQKVEKVQRRLGPNDVICLPYLHIGKRFIHHWKRLKKWKNKSRTKLICTTSFNIIHQFNLLVTKIKKFSSLLKRISRLKWNFTILCTKGVKSFLTTMKIHFCLQNESHSCSCTHIPVKSALR